MSDFEYKSPRLYAPDDMSSGTYPFATEWNPNQDSLGQSGVLSARGSPTLDRPTATESRLSRTASRNSHQARAIRNGRQSLQPPPIPPKPESLRSRAKEVERPKSSKPPLFPTTRIGPKEVPTNDSAVHARPFPASTAKQETSSRTSAGSRPGNRLLTEEPGKFHHRQSLVGSPVPSISKTFLIEVTANVSRSDARSLDCAWVDHENSSSIRTAPPPVYWAHQVTASLDIWQIVSTGASLDVIVFTANPRLVDRVTDAFKFALNEQFRQANIYFVYDPIGSPNTFCSSFNKVLSALYLSSLLPEISRLEPYHIYHFGPRY